MLPWDDCISIIFFSCQYRVALRDGFFVNLTLPDLRLSFFLSHSSPSLPLSLPLLSLFPLSSFSVTDNRQRCDVTWPASDPYLPGHRTSVFSAAVSFRHHVDSGRVARSSDMSQRYFRGARSALSFCPSLSSVPNFSAGIRLQFLSA